MREEKLGVEYLLEQSGIILPSDDDHLNREIDEGFEDGLMEEISETLSGGSPASYPSKSRIVEAICIHLCNKIIYPAREPKYVSR